LPLATSLPGKEGDDIQEDEPVASAAVSELEPECEGAESRNLPAAEQTTTTAAFILFKDVRPAKPEDHAAVEDGGESKEDCDVFCCTIL
jgi:hypothetical protein